MSDSPKNFERGIQLRVNLLTAILADARRRDGIGTVSSAFKLLRTDPAFRFVVCLRALKYFWRNRLLRFLLGFPYRYHKYKYGMQIPVQAQIGPAVLMPHFGGIVINSSAVIGGNCTIMHGVTIGSVLSGPRKGTPVIGSNVHIGPNAIVVGGITVGIGATIAPGAFVNIDVPENSLAIGNPARITQRRNNNVTS